MKKNYLLIILISLLVLSPKLYAQVECPCDFELVPKETECWIEPFQGSPNYRAEDFICLVSNACGDEEECQALIALQVEEASASFPSKCFIRSVNVAGCGPSQPAQELTPEELRACQCELLAYTTALNEVAGISVTGGPPYECMDVECAPIESTNVPTLSEWGSERNRVLD